MNTKLFIIVALAGVIVIAALYTALNRTNLNQVPESPSTNNEVPQLGAMGGIQGSLSFPSETIPADMVVCAQNVDTDELTCTNAHIVGEQFTYREGYKLNVMPGKYFVYAYLPDDPQRKAYYNEFVTCGLMASCESHDPIEVEVKAGETATEVDPQDWYQIAEPETTPTDQYEGQI